MWIKLTHTDYHYAKSVWSLSGLDEQIIVDYTSGNGGIKPWYDWDDITNCLSENGEFTQSIAIKW